MLTKKQLAAFRKAAMRLAFSNALLSCGFFRAVGIPSDQCEILNRIGATKEQKAELHRIHDEGQRVMRQSERERGLVAMKILSPEQQAKLIDELDRRDTEAQHSAKQVGKSTLMFTSSGPGGAKQAEQGQDSAVKEPSNKSTPKRPPFSGVFIPGSMPVDVSNIPTIAYHPLNDVESRKELKLSAEQETKLRAISRDFSSRRQEAVAKIRKEAETLSPKALAARREIRSSDQYRNKPTFASRWRNCLRPSS